MVRLAFDRGLVRDEPRRALGADQEILASLTSDIHRDWLLAKLPRATREPMHNQVAEWWRQCRVRLGGVLESQFSASLDDDDRLQSRILVIELLAAVRNEARQFELGGRAVEAVAALVSAERLLCENTMLGNRNEWTDDIDRQNTLGLLAFIKTVDESVDRLCRAVAWWPDRRRAQRLALEHHLAVAKTWCELEWYSRARQALDRAEDLLDPDDHAGRAAFLALRADVASFAGDVDGVRRAVTDLLRVIAQRQ